MRLAKPRRQVVRGNIAGDDAITQVKMAGQARRGLFRGRLHGQAKVQASCWRFRATAKT